MPSYSSAEFEYLFDLNGFVILDDALSQAQLDAVNTWVDSQPDVADGEWIGNVQLQAYSGSEGVLYQNIVEGGKIFRDLIDNPSWFPLVEKFICNNFNQVCLQEAWLNRRGPSHYIGLHSGGHVCGPVMKFKHSNTNTWDVGQINVLIALNDCGPGDGATVAIPGSHKSTVVHPHLADSEHDSYRNEVPANDVLGSKEVHLKAGQALFFSDAVCHGSAARTNPGERRFMVYRYCPHWIRQRYPYLPTPELLEQLTDKQRQILDPEPVRLTPGRQIVNTEPSHI